VKDSKSQNLVLSKGDKSLLAKNVQRFFCETEKSFFFWAKMTVTTFTTSTICFFVCPKYK
jgi:hypothetical protein